MTLSIIEQIARCLTEGMSRSWPELEVKPANGFKQIRIPVQVVTNNEFCCLYFNYQKVAKYNCREVSQFEIDWPENVEERTLLNLVITTANRTGKSRIKEKKL